MEYAQTAHNRSVNAPGLSGPPGFRSPRSLGLWPRSHGSLPPTVFGPRNATRSLIRASNRRLLPERYAQYNLHT
jgi:hypothetical protein